MTLTRLTVLRVSTAALVGLGGSWASAQPATGAAAPGQTQSDDYTRYELLDPSSASFRIVYEVTATSPGARFFWNPISKGSAASNESVLDPTNGQPLRFAEVSGSEARANGFGNAFDLYHDVTIREVGRSTYVNVVRAGSKVSNPSAMCLDTGEPLKVETLRGDEITKAKIDIGEPVKAESEAAVVRFPAVTAGASTRIRIRETYTDSARYRMEGDLLVWDRSFGRPRNAVILPVGYALVGSAFPAKVSITEDNRIRLDFDNPRNDEVRALIHARKRP